MRKIRGYSILELIMVISICIFILKIGYEILKPLILKLENINQMEITDISKFHNILATITETK